MKLDQFIADLQKARKRHGGEVEVVVNRKSFRRNQDYGFSHTATFQQKATTAVEINFNNRKNTKKVVKVIELKSY